MYSRLRLRLGGFEPRLRLRLGGFEPRLRLRLEAQPASLKSLYIKM